MHWVLPRVQTACTALDGDARLRACTLAGRDAPCRGERPAQTADQIVTLTDETIRSFIYELDVRNGLVYGTQTRLLSREARISGPGAGATSKI